RTMLRQLVDDAYESLYRERLVLSASEQDLELMDAEIADYRDAYARSQDAVQRSSARLALQMRPALDRAAESLKAQLSKEIDASDKWLGREDCQAWVDAHAMPFAIKATAAQLEQVIAEELERLDRELEEIANTATERVKQRAAIQSDAPARMARSLAASLGKRVGGHAATNALRGLGGVGGVAAGAGNLVKMAVKRIGALVGKKFGREVYTTIGRIFTKRVVTAAGAALSVAVDAGMFVYDAYTWRKELKKNVANAIDAWREAVRQELHDQQLPAIAKVNQQGIQDIYLPLLEEHERARSARGAEVAPQLARIDALLSELEKLQHRLSDVKEVA
ncbi:MAG TPA: hypothetical protein PLI95_18100, partial [Polyangiaceae bacterium]|nr:hypothetical protein [Polyangiaceae bacterium]